MTAASGALGTGRSTGGPAKAATLAMVWAYACATAIKGTKSIKTRSHAPLAAITENKGSPPMSESGQKRKSSVSLGMSALGV